MSQHSFNCPRTCPHYEHRDLCRFNRIFRALGNGIEVNSRTVTVKVEYDDPESLREAVEAMGGEWLGQGTHRLYQSQHRNVEGLSLIHI